MMFTKDCFVVISHCALVLDQPENWGALTGNIVLFVGSARHGPFRYRSSEYWKAANSMCKIDGLNLPGDELTVGIELGGYEEGERVASKNDLV